MHQQISLLYYSSQNINKKNTAQRIATSNITVEDEAMIRSLISNDSKKNFKNNHLLRNT